VKNTNCLGLVVTAIASLALITGCMSTPRSVREVSKSGFLDNDSQLKPGESKKEAKLIYINPDTDFSKYKNIYFEPVVVLVEKGSKLAKCEPEEIQALVDYLDATVRESLKEDYTFVKKAGPDVMRLRVALTDGKKATVMLNTMSSIMPPMLAVNFAKLAVTGTHLAVGNASIEFEVLDAASGDRLVAGVDARAGRKSLVSGNFSKWADTQDAFDYWAERLTLRLAELRAR
jgi:hypothetical protein